MGSVSMTTTAVRGAARARWRRLMQAKPRLSSTTMISFRPSITEVAISEFIMR